MMKKITNPNDIVDGITTDYRNLFGKELLSVIMYGSAVTHEYRPGASDINLAIVLADTSIPSIGRCMHIQKKWAAYRVETPFFMSKEYIQRSLDTYPVEFLDMQTNYRVLYGEDVLSGLNIQKEHLRIQCERELKSAALHLRKAYIASGGSRSVLQDFLRRSLRQLIPIFKALLVLGGRSIPGTKSDIISAVETEYNLGLSVLNDIFHSEPKKLKRRYGEIFDKYVKVVDTLVEKVDTMNHEGS